MLRGRAALTAAVAIVTFFVTAHALLQMPMLPDTDSYYHLAVARLYLDQGFVQQLPWARFSAMHDGFGDKELLFHVLLMPFSGGDAATGGRLAIALLNAALAGVITWIAIDALGAWGALLAPLLFLTAPYLWIRTMRLRPEVLSVLLLMLLAMATARRKVLTIALLSLVLTLSHTAFHVTAAIALMWLVATWIFERRFDWKPFVATISGIGAGIVLHPHARDMLRIWYVQNVDFLRMKGLLDSGAETQPPRIADLLAHNAGWWIAIAAAIVLLRAWKRKPSRETMIFATVAAVFFALQLMMERMATYFFPFATIAVAYACAGLARRRAFVTIVAIVAVVASASFSIRTARILRDRMPADVERDYAAFGAAVPTGAKVAARWGATDAYVFFAPQGRYLNVLDPVFMAVPHPREYAAQQSLFDGTATDLVLAAKELDSDYIAFARWEASPQFLARINHDPRFERVYGGYQVLLRVRPVARYGVRRPQPPLSKAAAAAAAR